MAKAYMPNQIKNVILLGHQGVGKTTLTEALLFASKTIAKKGTINEGNTISDYTKEERKAKISIYSSTVPFYYGDNKVNILDTPGFLDFAGEVTAPLRVANAAILMIHATKGIEVGTKKAWKYIKKYKLPTIIFINKTDKENANYTKVMEQIKDYFGNSLVVLNTPNGVANTFNGVTNQIESPEVKEAVSTHDDELMEKFLMEEPITDVEVKHGLKKAVSELNLVPVMVGSAGKDIGINELLDVIVNYLPSADTKVEKDVKVEVNAPTSAFVFKTIIDPFLGKISYVFVHSGSLKKDMTIYNSSKQLKDKLGGVYAVSGKEQIEVEALTAGDIGIVTKVNSLDTGDTFCDMTREVVFDPLDMPQPVVFYGIAMKNKNDEVKVGEGLKKAASEDLTLSVERNPETKQLVVGCQGQMHIDTVLERIKSTYNVTCALEDAKVSYRETIKGFADVEGRHKKQSGGAGQFGVVKVKFEPSDKDFEFVNDVFGGSVPTNFIPAVEKGLTESLKVGVLTGNPVVGIRATLYDGSYHPVDSNELSFKIAANLAFKEGMKKAKPTLLEPILSVLVTVPSDYVGDVMSNVSKNRGSVGDMESVDDEQIIAVEIPQIEFSKMVVELKTLTQAQASFSFKFLKYSEVPMLAAEKVIAAYKAAQEE